MKPRAWQLPPPDVVLDVETRWVLLRAFGPLERAIQGPFDAARAVSLVNDLSLVERIGARVPSQVLAHELGIDATRQLALTRMHSLARVQGIRDLIPELDSITEEAGVPVVFLKFAAMVVGGYSDGSSRAAGDVDLLLAARDVELFVRILVERGFLASDTPLADHHRFLHDRQGRVVELHTFLPGLRVPGGREFASVETLEAAGGLVPAPGAGRACRLLQRDFMAAHAIAHGLVHHGGADTYPLTRALADVIDVLPGERRRKGLVAADWLTGDVATSQLEAFLGLCDALERGDPTDTGVPYLPGMEGALLHHVVRSSLDPEYRRSLAIATWFHPLSNQPAWWRVFKRAQWAVFPTRAQLAADLGVPSARLITGRLRLAHLTDLARRLPRVARDLLAHVWRRVARGKLARSRHR